MKGSFRITILLLLCSLAGKDHFAQRRKPSSPEERARVVQMARDFEKNPFHEDAKKARLWFMKWIKEVPDITVNLCSNFLDPVKESEENYAAGLILHSEISSAAFIIENPDQAENPQAAFKAGVDGMLKMYQVVLKTYPTARWPFLDTLLELQKAGKSDEYLREATAKCLLVRRTEINKNYDQAGEKIYGVIEVTRRARILKKPIPQYTEGARMRRIEGTVLLKAVLASSGKVTDLTVIQGLPAGLTEQAIDAARKIKFEPALKENRPVSTLVQLEYNFNLY